MNTILAPIDFSDATAPVIAEAAALSRALAGRLVLLNVTTPPFIVPNDVGAAEMIVELTRMAGKSAEDGLARVQRKLQADGITAATRHRTGSPILGIVEEARALKADYMVIGSHGHGAFHDLLVGSTTSGVLKKAPCAVVVVPVKESKKKARKS